MQRIARNSTWFLVAVVCGLALPLVANGQVKSSSSKWLYAESEDPISGEVRDKIVLNGEEEFGGVLVVSCARYENLKRFTVLWDFENATSSTEVYPDIVVRFDDDPPRSGPFLSNGTTFVGGPMEMPIDLDFIGELTFSTKLAMRVENYGVAGITSVFDLTGSGDALTRLSKRCGIALPLQKHEENVVQASYGFPYSSEILVHWDNRAGRDYVLADEPSAERFCSERGYTSVVGFKSRSTKYKVVNQKGKNVRGDLIESIVCQK